MPKLLSKFISIGRILTPSRLPSHPQVQDNEIPARPTPFHPCQAHSALRQHRSYRRRIDVGEAEF